MRLLDLVRKLVGNDTLEIFGESGTGKTTFCMVLVKEALEEGMKVFYLDTERNIKDIPQHENFIYKYTPDLNEVVNYVMNLPRADLYILDSLGFPVLTKFAIANMSERGNMLLKAIAITHFLKIATYRHNAIAVVTNQPESEFGKNVPKDQLNPFGDKTTYGYKEIWRTSARMMKGKTEVRIYSWRSRDLGRGTDLVRMEITDEGVRYEVLLE